MAESTADKTHDPTPHRRQQAREAGHVARSYELSAAATVIGGIGGLYFFGVIPAVKPPRRRAPRRFDPFPDCWSGIIEQLHPFERAN